MHILYTLFPLFGLTKFPAKGKFHHYSSSSSSDVIDVDLLDLCQEQSIERNFFIKEVNEDIKSIQECSKFCIKQFFSFNENDDILLNNKEEKVQNENGNVNLMEKDSKKEILYGQIDERESNIIEGKNHQFQFVWQQSKEAIIDKLETIQFNELSSRTNSSIQLVCLGKDENNIIGFCEIFLWDIQNEQRLKERLLELDKKNNNFFLKKNNFYKNQNHNQKLVPKISNLCVDSKYRRQGIGETLFKSCIKIATERKWPTDVVLLAVDSDNIIARNFYFQKLNFQDVLVDSSLYRYVINTERFFLKFKRAKLDSERSPKVIMMYSNNKIKD